MSLVFDWNYIKFTDSIGDKWHITTSSLSIWLTGLTCNCYPQVLVWNLIKHDSLILAVLKRTAGGLWVVLADELCRGEGSATVIWRWAQEVTGIIGGIFVTCKYFLGSSGLLGKRAELPAVLRVMDSGCVWANWGKSGVQRLRTLLPYYAFFLFFLLTYCALFCCTLALPITFNF